MQPSSTPQGPPVAMCSVSPQHPAFTSTMAHCRTALWLRVCSTCRGRTFSYLQSSSEILPEWLTWSPGNHFIHFTEGKGREKWTEPTTWRMRLKISGAYWEGRIWPSRRAAGERPLAFLDSCTQRADSQGLSYVTASILPQGQDEKAFSGPL